jgi:hypothetical protein
MVARRKKNKTIQNMTSRAKTEKKQVNKKGGFVALTSTLLIMAILIFVVRGISLQIIDDSQIGFSSQQYLKAKYLSDACAEFALLQLANNPLYDSGSTQTDGLGGGECEVVDINNPGSGDITIQVESNVDSGEYIYRTEIVVSTTTATTTPSVVVDSWEEVDSF